MNDQTKRILLVVILLAAFAYLLAFLHGINSPEIRLLPDSHEYLSAARNLKNHGIYYSGSLKTETDYSLYSRRPPGYPFLLMLFSRLSSSVLLPVIFQVLLIFLGGFFLWKINENVGVPDRLNLLALAVYLLYPGQIIYSQMIMAETLLQFLLLFSVYCLMLFLRNEKMLPILGLNLCLGAAVLMKPAMLYFWVPNLAIHLLLCRKTSKKMLLLAPLIPLLCISLWSWRNYNMTGVYHYSSLQVAHMKFYLPGDDSIESRSKDDFQKEVDKTEAMSAEIMRDPDEFRSFTTHSAKNFIAFFLDPGRFDLYQFLPLKSERVSARIFYHPVRVWGRFMEAVPVPVLITLALLLAGNLIILAAFIPSIFNSKINFFLRLYLLVLILYMGAVVSVAALGTARYRLSVEPLLIIGATVTAASAWRYWNKKRARL